MSKKIIKKESKKTTLARVKEEMAAPRMAKSARDYGANRAAGERIWSEPTEAKKHTRVIVCDKAPRAW